MKLGLHLFIGQVIALVTLLVVLSVGILLALYYTNSRSSLNNMALMKEVVEKSRLNHINILVANARQTEKGFYARPNDADAQAMLSSLQQAHEIVRMLNEKEEAEESAIEEQNEFGKTHYNQDLFELIERDSQLYRQLFKESLGLWKERGYSRNAGLGHKLKEIAYQGLRSRLDHYHTEALLTSIYRLRWLEYEYYSYGNKYLNELEKQINKLITEVRNSQLVDDLRQELLDEAEQFRVLLILKRKNPKQKIGRMEDHSSRLAKIIEQHSITDFPLLIQTILYYEMEYRELGQQDKHVRAINRTLDKLQQRIKESQVLESEKQVLLEAVAAYRQAFAKLVALDKKIHDKKIEITQVYERLVRNIDESIAREERSLLAIQEKMQEQNLQNTRINTVVTIVVLLIAIFFVSLIVRGMNRKISSIGKNLKALNKGELEISADIPKESRRDELDWIGYYVIELSKSLARSMGALKKRNDELERISNKLSKYLSPQVYRSIFTGQQAVNIQSQRKKLTVFFSDIVSFTNTSEQMESEDLTTILNDYLNEMSKIALKHGGTIDKFIGDAIMIFFGDPETKGSKKDCLSCIYMALEMRDKMTELDHRWTKQQGYLQPFKIRMGISTGYCTVGNFGSEERMDYTIIGRQVNLASRLESQAQPNEILISHESYTLVQDKILCEPQEKIMLKGVSEPVQSYKVIGVKKNFSAREKQYALTRKGFSLQVNPHELSDEDKKEIRETLEKITNKL